MKQILVTGASGMVGRHFQEVVDDVEAQAVEYVYLSSKDCNLLDRHAVNQLFANNDFTAIIHLAARVGGLYDNMRNNLEMFNDNIDMAMNVLRAAHANGVQRGIFCLSSCIYPAGLGQDQPMTEEDLHKGAPHDSNMGYAYAKRIMEVLCRLYGAEGREYICVSPVNLYGPHDNFSAEGSHVIPGLIRRMYEHKIRGYRGPFQVWGTGNARRQFMHAETFARAIHRIFWDMGVKKGVYNICPSGSDVSIREVVELIATELNFSLDKIEYDCTHSDGVQRKLVSAEKFHGEYQDFTFYDLHSGLTDTVKWYVQNYPNVRGHPAQ